MANKLSNKYDERIKELTKLTSVNLSDIKFFDNEIISYIIKEFDYAHYLPSLQGCYFNNFNDLYNLVNLVKPKNIGEFILILNLVNSKFHSKKLILKDIKEYGINSIITSKPKLLSYLIKSNNNLNYDEAIKLINNLEKLKLSISDFNLSNYLKEEILNIKNLFKLSDSTKLFNNIYYLAYFKIHYEDIFYDTLIKEEGSFVGPFFYIDSKVYAYKEKVESFNVKLLYFDSNMGHMLFFNTLNKYGEYSYYPRGRVLFDNLNKIYRIFIDKSLNKAKIKEEIINEYKLKNKKVKFCYDEHYVTLDY